MVAEYLRQLGDKDPEVRRHAAVRLWGSAGRADVREALTKRMRDKDVDVRIVSIQGVATLAETVDDVRAAVLARLTKESDASVWRTIVFCLAPALRRNTELRAAADARAETSGGRFADALQEALQVMYPEG
jgi:hypothetical protein